MRPRLKSLSVSGFRSFIDGGHVEFPKAGLTLLAGLNKDTGGSSGSGKSSVLVAIAFALGYAPWPATALGSRGSDKPLRVELTLETDEGTVVIRRGTSTPTLWVNGEQIRGGAKAVEERLKKILGVEPDILSLLTYRGQRKPGLFLSKTDGEKKELLVQLIPRLAKYEQAVEASQERIKNLEAMEAGRRSQVEYAQAMLAPFEDLRDPAQLQLELDEAKRAHQQFTAVRDRAKQVVDRLSAERLQEAEMAFMALAPEINSVLERLSAIEEPVVDFDGTESQRLNELIESATQRIDAAVKADAVKQREHRARRQLLQEKLLACRQVASQRAGLLKEQERAQRELVALEANECPTCLRPWEDGEKVSCLHVELQALAEQLQLCDLAETNEADLQEQLDSLPDVQPNPIIVKLQEARSKAQEQLRGEQSRRQMATAAARAQFLQARAELDARVSELKLAQQQARSEVLSRPVPELEKAQSIVASATASAQEHSMTVTMLTSMLQDAFMAQERRKKCVVQLMDAQAEHQALLVQINEERDFLGVLGREGFLGSIFDEVLADISDETNKILASVANTRHCTLHFRSESVTQKGTVRKAIVPVVVVDGIEAPLEAGTSGGMLSAIELAVDLAVGKVVSEREGVSPGWLVLDESFGGLGSVEMESCLEILNRYAQDRLVLVVEHSTEFKSMFPNSINVEYQAGRSRFV